MSSRLDRAFYDLGRLDLLARRQLIELLKSFRHSKIIATHDLDMVLDICERTIIMNEGRIEADGPTAEIFQDEELLACCHLEKPLRLQKYPVCSTQRKASCKNCFS